MRWIAGRQGIDGILSPVMDGRRYMQQISNNEIHLLEVDGLSNHSKVQTIGRYRFDQNVFAWAQMILRSCIEKSLEWLIIDEIGPLELQGNGLEPAVGQIINIARNNDRPKLLLVIRENLLQDALRHFDLTAADLQEFNLNEEFFEA